MSDESDDNLKLAIALSLAHDNDLKHRPSVPQDALQTDHQQRHDNAPETISLLSDSEDERANKHVCAFPILIHLFA